MTISDLSPSTNTKSPQHFFRYLIRWLADLRLAIILLLTIALFSISGTLLEQGQSLSFYQTNYPESPALFGFLSWKVILAVGLDHVYSTWWFLSILVVFGSSLTACTFSRQIPALKAAKRWKFYEKPKQFQKLALSTQIKTQDSTVLVNLLQEKGYKVFQKGQAIYARKGMIGRIGPIIVHAAMLLILAGAIWGNLTGFIAQEMIPSGAVFQVSNIFKSGPFSSSSVPKDWAVKVNRFWIDYTTNGTIDQFYSDLSVVDEEGKELDHKIIRVNEPLRYDGVTFYQTDWGIAGITVQVNQSPLFQLPMRQLPTQTENRIWGAWIPTKPDLSEGVAILATDLQGTMMVYDTQGNLFNAIRPGFPLEINGVTLTVKELFGSTGLQIKADPGIPLVYLGFALVMIGVLMSYASHSQIWALQDHEAVYFGGKTNRAQVTFEREWLGIIESIDAKSPGTA